MQTGQRELRPVDYGKVPLKVPYFERNVGSLISN